MRKFFQLYIGLLVPLSGLFIVVAVIYFNNGYDFTKSLRLGVLTGFFIALAVAFFITVFLFIIRRSRKTKQNIPKKVHKTKTTDVQKSLKETTPVKLPKVETTPTKDPKTNTQPIEKRVMLLMDKELALEVVYCAISEQKIGTFTQDKENKNHLTIKSNKEIIELTISPLTRHTVQIDIRSTSKSPNIKNIINYLKEKEYSFLQY